jgi:predicted permease
MDKKFKLDSYTLTKLNFYIFVPAFTFVNVTVTEISFDLARVIILMITLLVITYFFGTGLGRLLRLPVKTRKAFENSIMFCNSGNIGVSLMTLVFSGSLFMVNGTTPFLEIAISVQVMTLLVQNLTVNTIGFINSGGEGMTLKKGLITVLKMPTIYAVSLALLLKLVPIDITMNPVWSALEFLRFGLIPVSLIALGAGLSKAKLNFKLKIPYLAAICRLLGGPAIAFGLIYLFGFDGVMAKAILIASSTPTAINTALLSIETKGDSDFAMQTVTIATLLSAVTMTTVVYLAYILF